MRRANLIVALGLLLISVLVIVDSVRLGFRWGTSGPESGFFPFWLGVGLLVCSLLVLKKVVSDVVKKVPEKRLAPPGAWKSILWVILPAIGMVLVTELVGLHVAAALYLGFYMRAVGKTPWVTTVAVSILVPLSLYVAFDKLFMVPLPQGLWGATLMPF
jgi:putative tricarboxylic transport membrane protein